VSGVWCLVSGVWCCGVATVLRCLQQNVSCAVLGALVLVLGGTRELKRLLTDVQPEGESLRRLVVLIS
jgi:hypothetical protein